MAADDLLVPAARGPRHRADAALRRASRRDGTVVTPDTMASHMDHTDTVVIPRHAVTAADPRAVDPDSTVVLPALRRR
ncbi:hypothetical protein GCM10027047_07680 [Rhodococcus aerolatus]